jgi:protein SCO1/2
VWSIDVDCCDFAGAAVVVAACARRSFESLDVSGADWGKDFRPRDAEDRERSLADFRGKAVLVFFGFTQCPDVWPTALSRAAEVLRLLRGRWPQAAGDIRDD